LQDLTSVGNKVAQALACVCHSSFHSKEIIEADGVPSLWKCFLATRSADALEKCNKISRRYYLPLMECFRGIATFGYASAVTDVIEIAEIVKLIDEDLKGNDETILIVPSLIHTFIVHGPSNGASPLEKMCWLQKVNVY
jgi:hypothetical protein